MDFLKSYLPGPVVDIFLPIAILLGLAYFLIPKLIAKLKDTGVWDRAARDRIDPRRAAHAIAVERVAEATALRGLYP